RKRIVGEARAKEPRVLRIGSSLFIFTRDLLRYAGGRVTVEDGMVVGPVLRAFFHEVDRAARQEESLLILGESGSGKELAARRFHAAGPNGKGRFIAVNCATIARDLAERLLFGTRRGAYSGADADAEGYAQAADGGVLFLDEVGELLPDVQAK